MDAETAKRIESLTKRIDELEQAFDPEVLGQSVAQAIETVSDFVEQAGVGFLLINLEKRLDNLERTSKGIINEIIKRN